jgi:hypothetical protein
LKELKKERNERRNVKERERRKDINCKRMSKISMKNSEGETR